MKHLAIHLEHIEKQVLRSDILLFLDYDGTLTPIVDRPEKALIPPESRSILEQLARCPQCTVAVVSGRALKDVRRLVGVKGIVYAGNHGLELSGPRITFNKVTSTSYMKILGQIRKVLEKELERFPGAFLEDKGVVLTLHYRLLKPGALSALKTAFHEAAAPHIAKGQISIKRGKKVLEIKPDVSWDKGKVVLWLLARRKFVQEKNLLPIYLGDDITDEDAFQALKDRGLTVFVGTPRKSKAEYFLKSYAEVRAFLEWLHSIKCQTNRKR